MFIPLPVIVVGLVILFAAVFWAMRRGKAGDVNEIAAPRSPASLQGRDTDGRHSGGASSDAPAPVTQSNAQRDLTGAEREELKKILRNGHKINAIKVAREMLGVGLAEAKDLVEALEEEEQGGL